MSVKSPANFAAGVLLPALSLGLLLSLGLNGVLVATRVSPAAAPVSVQQMSSSVAVAPDSLPPQGFGNVTQGQRMLAQKIDGIPSGVFKYELSKGMLPALPPAFTLYRDQGVAADPAPFLTILNGMHAPLNFANLRLLPEDITFNTADGVYSILVNVNDRSLEVSRIDRSADDVSGQPVINPMTDERMITLAEAMAQSLGIDTSAMGTPSVIKTYRTVEAGSKGTVLAPGIEEVRWPLLFGTYPLVDDLGRPISGLSIFVGHRSQQAVALNMHLLSPEMLSHADYPSADPAIVTGFALEGGMAPIDGDTKGKSVPVAYQSAELVYVLPRYNPDRTTYVFPAIAFSSDIARTACKVKPCTPWTWTTYVPVLDPNTFTWLQGSASSVSSVAPASSSAAVSSAASSAAPAKASSSAKAVSSAAAKAKSSSAAATKPASSASGDPNAGLQILR